MGKFFTSIFSAVGTALDAVYNFLPSWLGFVFIALAVILLIVLKATLDSDEDGLGDGYAISTLALGALWVLLGGLGMIFSSGDEMFADKGGFFLLMSAYPLIYVIVMLFINPGRALWSLLYYVLVFLGCILLFETIWDAIIALGIVGGLLKWLTSSSHNDEKTYILKDGTEIKGSGGNYHDRMGNSYTRNNDDSFTRN